MIGELMRVRRPGDARHGHWAYVRRVEGNRVTIEFESDGVMSDDYTIKDLIDSDTCLRCGARLLSSLSRSLHEC